LCDPSNLLFEYSFYLPMSDALFSNYFEDLFKVVREVFLFAIPILMGLWKEVHGAVDVTQSACKDNLVILGRNSYS